MLANNINYDSSNLSNEPNTLDATETLELINLEAKVEKSLRSFFEIGQALREIRTKRLYRKDYTTFEDYCLNRWEMSRRTTDQLIAAASTYENFQRHGAQIVPTSERKIRSLTSLPPEKQLEIWNQAVSSAPGGKITSTHVAQLVQNYKQQSKENKNRQNDSMVKDTEITNSEHRSCWNCHYSSSELIKDEPHKFYCYKLGKLDFIEKNASQRAEECELWTEKTVNKDIFSQITLPEKEYFSLTLQLPTYWQVHMEELAKEQGLDVENWVTQILERMLENSNL